jgi:hypothetical protein
MSGNQSDSLSYIIENGYQIESSIYINNGFRLLKQNFIPLAGYGIFCIAIQIGVQQLLGINKYSDIFAGIVNINLVGPLYSGFFYFLFRKLKGKSPGIQAFFSGFKRNRFFTLVASFLLPFLLSFIGGYSFIWMGDISQFSALYIVGILLFIFPGIYLSVAYTFALPLIVEKQFNFWKAMETSRKIVTRRWWGVFGFFVVFGFFMLLVSLPVILFWFVLIAVYANLSQAAPLEMFQSTFVEILEFVVNGALSGFISLWWICSITVAYERIIGFQDVRAAGDNIKSG